MDSKDFIRLLKHPEEVEQLPLDELKKLSLEYPYSQPVQLLYAIRLGQSSEYLFNKQLEKTAIMTDDRTVLFDLFEREQEELGKTVVLTQKGDGFNEPTPKAEPELGIHMEETPEVPESMEAPQENIPEEESEVVEKEEPAPVPVAEKPVQPVAPPPPQPKAEPLDLSGLSPQEKVQAILAQNKRIREEHEQRKAGIEVEPSAPVVEPFPPAVPAPEVVETQEEVVEAEEAPSFEITPPEVEENIEETAATEAVETESLTEAEHQITVDEVAETPTEEAPSTVLEEETPDLGEPEVEEEVQSSPVFTIDEEVQEEPIFEIESPEIPEQPQEESLERNLDSEKHSLSEWLQILRNRRDDEELEDETPEELPVEKKIELLDSFVEKLPELKRKNLDQPTPPASSINTAQLSSGEDDALVTETLAKVYISQKHYSKAIKAYEILKLKYPEKSGFFADQIFEINKLINRK